MRHVDLVRTLAADIPTGWHVARDHDGLVLYDGAEEPLTLVYGGLDVARYLVACDPAKLLPVLSRLTE